MITNTNISETFSQVKTVSILKKQHSLAPFNTETHNKQTIDEATQSSRHKWYYSENWTCSNTRKCTNVQSFSCTKKGWEAILGPNPVPFRNTSRRNKRRLRSTYQPHTWRFWSVSIERDSPRTPSVRVQLRRGPRGREKEECMEENTRLRLIWPELNRFSGTQCQSTSHAYGWSLHRIRLLGDNNKII